MPHDLIILGASARAAAASAIRAGFSPWCIDRFADTDLRAMAPVHRCPPQRYPHGMLPLLDDAPQAPVLITGAMENHPDLLRAIAFRFPFLASGPEAIEASRSHPLPGQPVTRKHRPLHVWLLGSRRWLVKPVRSGGGHGILFPRRLTRLPRGCVVQRYLPGTPMAAAYFADGWSGRLLGVTRQIIGDARLHAAPFAYAGSIGPIDLPDAPRQTLTRLGVALTQRFDLRGIFGIDFILDARQRVHPIEINPRYIASLEVLERATGLAMLRAPSPAPPRTAPHGKAILFAPSRLTVPATLSNLLPAAEIADLPAAGTRVEAGEPICTVFARGANEQAVLDGLHARAVDLYTHLAYAAHHPRDPRA